MSAAAREVKEETGFLVRVTGFLGMWMDDYGDPRDLETTLNNYFHAVPVGEVDVDLDPKEVDEIGWFSPPSLPTSTAFPGHIPAVLEAWKHEWQSGSTVTTLLGGPDQR